MGLTALLEDMRDAHHQAQSASYLELRDKLNELMRVQQKINIELAREHVALTRELAALRQQVGTLRAQAEVEVENPGGSYG